MNITKLIVRILLIVSLSWLTVRPPWSASAGLASTDGIPYLCYVKGDAQGANTGTSWTDAYIDLQSALSDPNCGEVWVAAGTYKPYQETTYTSCQEIRISNPSAGDGNYLIRSGVHSFQVYCADMAGTPKEYLGLVNTTGANYSQYTAGGASSGTSVRTYYSKLRLHPDTLTVDISDQTYATSTGSLTQSGRLVTSMPYGTAADCIYYDSHAGVGNIDLRGTPFKVHSSESFALGGYLPGGGATFLENRQVVNLQAGGFCGWIAPAPGIYEPYNLAGGPILELEIIPNPRDVSFQLKNGIEVYGGFSGTELERSQRDWKAHPTILSGEIGTAEPSDNSYHVVRGENIQGATLDGFMISGGNADGTSAADGRGGGLYTYLSEITVRNVHFLNNQAFGGGGMFSEGGQVTLEDVTFYQNTALINGGGFHPFNGCHATLTNVRFSGNTAALRGGGLANWANSTAILTGVTFLGNSANTSGGGMVSYSNSTATLTGVTFSGNSATNGGGLGGWFNTSSTLTNVTFFGNTAQLVGGGINIDESSIVMTNTLFVDNQAGKNGGGLGLWDSSATLTNVTLSGNKTLGSDIESGGGGIFNSWGSSILTNMILWGNTAITGPQISNDSGTVTLNYSLVEGGCPLEVTCDSHLRTDNPLFVDAAGGNLHMLPGSPAIDRGDSAAPGLTGITTDLDGNPRFVDLPSIPDQGAGAQPYIDLGAYEADIAPFVSSNFPADGAVGIPVQSNILLTFSEPVTLSEPWFTITCTASGTHGAAVSGGPTDLILNPAVNYDYGELCTITIVGLKVSDQDTHDPFDTMSADHTFSFTTRGAPPFVYLPLILR